MRALALRKAIFRLGDFGLRDGCELLIAEENPDLLDVFLSAGDEDFFKEVDADRNFAQLFFQSALFLFGDR